VAFRLWFAGLKKNNNLRLNICVMLSGAKDLLF
jgi:hypothetical protein